MSLRVPNTGKLISCAASELPFCYYYTRLYLQTPLNGSQFDVNIHVYLSCGMTSRSQRQLMFPVRSSLL